MIKILIISSVRLYYTAFENDDIMLFMKCVKTKWNKMNLKISKGYKVASPGILYLLYNQSEQVRKLKYKKIFAGSGVTGDNSLNCFISGGNVLNALLWR